MSTYTQWYLLDKYEGTDKPNLLDQYNTSMEKIDSAMKSLQNQINGSASDLEPRVEDLEKPNHNFYSGKNAVFIGDSYTVGQGASDYQTTRKKRFSTLICDDLNMTQFNYAVGSTGFINDGSGSGHNDPFMTQLQTAYNAMSETERNNTALVCISGGFNDRDRGYTHTAEADAAYEVVSTAAECYPNATILVTPMMYKGFAFTPDALDKYNAIVEGAERAKVAKIIIGAYTWNFGDSTKFNADRIHPNDTGYRIIADYMLSAIKNNNLVLWEDKVFQFTYEPNFTDSSGYPNYIYIKEGLVYINTVRFIANANVSSNTRIAYIPNCCAPYRFQCEMASHSSTPLGLVLLTDSGQLFINPYVNAIAETNYWFICGCFVYNLYGSDYNA